MNNDVVLVNIMEEIVLGIQGDKIPYVNFEPGSNYQIIKAINNLDNSLTLKGKKYPLIAMLMPAHELRGSIGFYAKVRIDKIVIATYSNNTDSVLRRYKDGGSFKSVLYPIYYEFLRQLSLSKHIIGVDGGTFSHTKEDNPGSRSNDTSTDYIDTISLLNLELILNQIKTC